MNPAQLKLDLVTHGVLLAKGAETSELVHGAEGGAPTRASVELFLPGDLWVSAPLRQEGARFTLIVEGDSHLLTRGEERTEVRIVPAPAFYGHSTPQGTPMWRIARVYGGCLVISPLAPCGLALWGAPCVLCAAGAASADLPPPVPVAEVVEVVRAAFAEGAAELVYFSGGYTATEDRGIAALEPYVRAVKRHFDTLVAVQMHPPETNAWIDQAYAIGVDAVSFNIEIHDAEIFSRHFPGRARSIGRERYYEALRYAAAIFPSGTVWSELLLGVESLDSTLQAIDTLTAMGVLPVLAPAPSANGTPWPTSEEASSLVAHLFKAVRDAKINMGWVRDLSFAIAPLEARFFAGDEARVAVAMQTFYRTRVGSLAARNLSRLRRRLRVRKVGDSFDASHL